MHLGLEYKPLKIGYNDIYKQENHYFCVVSISKSYLSYFICFSGAIQHVYTETDCLTGGNMSLSHARHCEKKPRNYNTITFALE